MIARIRDKVEETIEVLALIGSAYRMVRTRRRLGETWQQAVDHVCASESERLTTELVRHRGSMNPPTARRR